MKCFLNLWMNFLIESINSNFRLHAHKHGMSENTNNINGVVGGHSSIYSTTLKQIVHELNHIVTSSIKICCWNWQIANLNLISYWASNFGAYYEARFPWMIILSDRASKITSIVKNDFIHFYKNTFIFYCYQS